MTEAEWLACDDPREMIGRVLHSASARKLRLFAVVCCRCSRQLLLNSDHRRAVDLAERFADGHATEKELSKTYRRANTFALELYQHFESERAMRRWSEATAVLNATHVVTRNYHMSDYAADAAWHIHRAAHRNPNPRLIALLHDIFGNPFRPVALDPAWLTSDVLALARGIYADRAFDRMPILADALQDAGCNQDDVLTHCRDANAVHVRGCWVVDLLLGKG